MSGCYALTWHNIRGLFGLLVGAGILFGEDRFENIRKFVPHLRHQMMVRVVLPAREDHIRVACSEFCLVAARNKGAKCLRPFLDVVQDVLSGDLSLKHNQLK